MSKSKSGPVTVTRSVPRAKAWNIALIIVGSHNTERLFVLPNGAVIIANTAKRPEWIGRHLG